VEVQPAQGQFPGPKLKNRGAGGAHPKVGPRGWSPWILSFGSQTEKEDGA